MTKPHKPYFRNLELYNMGSIKWQDAIIHNITLKSKLDIPLNEIEKCFIPAQIAHTKRILKALNPKRKRKEVKR